jgi:hypothetical protein
VQEQTLLVLQETEVKVKWRMSIEAVRVIKAKFNVRWIVLDLGNTDISYIISICAMFLAIALGVRKDKIGSVWNGFNATWSY